MNRSRAPSHGLMLRALNKKSPTTRAAGQDLVAMWWLPAYALALVSRKPMEVPAHAAHPPIRFRARRRDAFFDPPDLTHPSRRAG
jgi:hypothetical protein